MPLGKGKKAIKWYTVDSLAYTVYSLALMEGEENDQKEIADLLVPREETIKEKLAVAQPLGKEKRTDKHQKNGDSPAHMERA